MMKTKRPLNVDLETIRTLTGDQLKDAQGGSILGASHGTYGCKSARTSPC